MTTRLQCRNCSKYPPKGLDGLCKKCFIETMQFYAKVHLVDAFLPRERALFCWALNRLEEEVSVDSLRVAMEEAILTAEVDDED